MSSIPYKNVTILLQLGSCCTERFIGSAKTCIKCLKPCDENPIKVDKIAKLYMCNYCFDTSNKCKICNKNLEFGHNIIECKTKYNLKITPTSNKEKMCTYAECTNFCKKHDFCKNHYLTSKCKHCNIMYKPNRVDNNECKDCFKCNTCNIFKKENNKNRDDTRCIKCDKEEMERQKENERLLQIEDTKRQIENERLQVIEDRRNGIYKCKRCKKIISLFRYNHYTKKCNTCYDFFICLERS